MNNIDNIIRNSIKVGLFVVFATPLIFVSNFFFPFIVPKNLLFRIVVEIAFTAYIWLAFKDQQYRFKVNWLNILVLLYFLVLAVTSLTGIYFPRSFWGNYERMDGLLNQFHLLLYFILLVGILKQRKEWYQLFSFSLGTSLIMSVFALGQKLNFSFFVQTDNVRLAVTIGNAAFFASYLLFHFFFLLFFVFKPKRFQVIPFLVSFFSLEVFLIINTLSKGMAAYQAIASDRNFVIFFLVFNAIMVLLWLYRKSERAVLAFLLAFLLLNFFDLFSSGTRGAFLGLGISSLVLLLFYLFAGNKKEKIISLTVIALGVLLVGIVFLNKDNDWVKNNPNIQNILTTSFTNVTVESRLLTWQSSWQMVTASPFRFIAGYGLENFHILFDKYFNQKMFREVGSQVWFDRAHNLIFDLWTTSGLLGLLSYLGILVLAVVYLLKAFLKDSVKNKDAFIIFAAIFISYFIQILFVFDTLNTYVLIFLCFAFASFIYSENFEEKHKFLPERRINLGIITKLVLVCVLVFCLWFFNAKVVIANTNLVKGSLFDYFKISKQNALDYFIRSTSEEYLGKFEADQQLMAYSRALVADKTVPMEFSFKVAQETIKEYKNNIEMDPLNVKHYLYLGSFYNDVGMTFIERYHQQAAGWTQDTIDLMNKAIPLSSTRPQIYFVKARALFYQNKREEAFATFREGVNLAPWVGQLHIDLAVLYILGDRADLAQKELDYTINNIEPLQEDDYSRLANIYNAKKNYTKAAEIYVKLVGLNPQKINYYALAAGAFAQAGDNKSAKEWALKAVEIDPSVQPQIANFLDELEKGKFKASN